MAFYVAFGLLWFGAAEVLAPHWVDDPVALPGLLRWKTYIFVFITGLLAAWQVRRMMRAEAARVATMQEFFHIVRHAPVGIARVEPGTGHVQWANAGCAACWA
jgi:hypothetical protein